MSPSWPHSLQSIRSEPPFIVEIDDECTAESFCCDLLVNFGRHHLLL